MPSGGAGARANQKTAIAGIIHDKKIDPALGDLLRRLDEGGKVFKTNTSAAQLL